jgi:hypothetical protein
LLLIEEKQRDSDGIRNHWKNKCFDKGRKCEIESDERRENLTCKSSSLVPVSKENRRGATGRTPLLMVGIPLNARESVDLSCDDIQRDNVTHEIKLRSNTNHRKNLKFDTSTCAITDDKR